MNILWHQKRRAFPCMGDTALGSTYLLMKSCMISSESLKSEALLSLACLWTFPKVSLKSSIHQIDFLTSKLLVQYLDGQACTRSVSRVLETWGSNTHQKDWFWESVCDMRNKRQRRDRRQRKGRCFWRCGNGCWRWKRCSYTSRRTAWKVRYKEGSNATSVGPVSCAIDHGEGHLVVPFGWFEYFVRSRGFRVKMELGRLGLVWAATSTSSRILFTDWNRWFLASLKMGKLPPSPLSPRRVVKVK